jgi:hypothetical protein
VTQAIDDPDLVATALLSIDLDQLDAIETARPQIRIVAPLVPNSRSVVRRPPLVVVVACA